MFRQLVTTVVHRCGIIALYILSGCCLEGCFNFPHWLLGVNCVDVAFYEAVWLNILLFSHVWNDIYGEIFNEFSEVRIDFLNWNIEWFLELSTPFGFKHLLRVFKLISSLFEKVILISMLVGQDSALAWIGVQILHTVDGILLRKWTIIITPRLVQVSLWWYTQEVLIALCYYRLCTFDVTKGIKISLPLVDTHVHWLPLCLLSLIFQLLKCRFDS